MKDYTFDAKIVAASPYSDKINSFVKQTMQQINRAHPPKKQSFVLWAQLHKPAFALLAFIAVVLLGSAVYAAVHFAPAFVQLLGKETNQRGATEYSIAGFGDCAKNDGPALKRLEVKKDANLSDDEVHKILQARCEMLWLQNFPGKVWPTTGTNAEWKDGDTIYYTRLDMLGGYKNGDQNHATIDFGGNVVEHTPPNGEKIRAFAAGEEIQLGGLKPGDTVFTISRVSETYHEMKGAVFNKSMNQLNVYPSEQPKVIGLVALFKMSLPLDYYIEKQMYVTEVPECPGNPGELCPNTASVDVYPRAGGEGASNPYRTPFTESNIMRQISGTVTQLGDDTLTLKSRSGKTYTVTVGDAGFKDYNQNYTQAYGSEDVTLRVGSTVQIIYVQAQNDDVTKITKQQVERVTLQLDSLNPKKDTIKQY